MTNQPVTQPNTRSNRNCSDPWVANPLVAGSSPARPTPEAHFSRSPSRCQARNASRRRGWSFHLLTASVYAQEGIRKGRRCSQRSGSKPWV
jgi:hypothetical protein